MGSVSALVDADGISLHMVSKQLNIFLCSPYRYITIVLMQYYTPNPFVFCFSVFAVQGLGFRKLWDRRAFWESS